MGLELFYLLQAKNNRVKDVIDCVNQWTWHGLDHNAEYKLVFFVQITCIAKMNFWRHR